MDQIAPHGLRAGTKPREVADDAKMAGGYPCHFQFRASLISITSRIRIGVNPDRLSHDDHLSVQFTEKKIRKLHSRPRAKLSDRKLPSPLDSLVIWSGFVFIVRGAHLHTFLRIL
jgi:hypothetical protein